MFKKIIFLLFTLISSFCDAQKFDSAAFFFSQSERELKDLQKKTFHSRSEKERIEGNKEFMRAWDKIITNPKILHYAFDSLKDVSVLSPRDKSFKLITWNLFLDNGTHAFFGYLLVNRVKTIKTGFMKHKVEESYEYFRLIDRSSTVPKPETYVGTPEKWFGMLYTQLIECDGFYTLIGWDGNDRLTQRKFVDVLYFRGDGSPVFGKDVFKFPKKNPRRLMFECSQEVNMSLKYNPKRELIIYTHLSPKKEGELLEGQFQYYGPDGRYDALELQKDKWVVLEDIEANSEINPIKESKKPNPRKRKKILPGTQQK